MATNTLEDLRAHLFKTIEALRGAENPMSIDRAKAISDVAQTVINSAKAEIDYLKATDQNDAQLPVFGPTKADEPGKLPDGLSRITTHRLK